MDINEIIKAVFKNQIVNSLIIVIISYVVYTIIKNLIFKSGKLAIGSKSTTYIKMLQSIIRYIFIIVTVLIILQINGVDVSSMLAGIGIVSVVVGFALQDAIKDIIKGFNILSDGYFKVGDIIKYNNIEGKVIVIGLKTTKIKDIVNQNTISIANRNIKQVEIVSNQIDIEIPLPYELKKEAAEKVLEEITDTINKRLKVDSCNYIGINKFDDSSLNYLIRIQCNVETKYQTKRDSRSIIVEILEKHKIQIPYTQIDVNSKAK